MNHLIVFISVVFLALIINHIFESINKKIEPLECDKDSKNLVYQQEAKLLSKITELDQMKIDIIGLRPQILQNKLQVEANKNKISEEVNAQKEQAKKQQKKLSKLTDSI